MERATLKKYGVRHEDWYVRYASLSIDRWLRIDTRDQRWQPYVSSSWRQRGWGLPQLGQMPWYSERDYERWGIDLGDDPNTMDDDAFADHRYRYQTEETEEEED